MFTCYPAGSKRVPICGIDLLIYAVLMFGIFCMTSDIWHQLLKIQRYKFLCLLGWKQLNALDFRGCWKIYYVLGPSSYLILAGLSVYL